MNQYSCAIFERDLENATMSQSSAGNVFVFKDPGDPTILQLAKYVSFFDE